LIAFHPFLNPFPLLNRFWYRSTSIAAHSTNPLSCHAFWLTILFPLYSNTNKHSFPCDNGD
jgi:hypothetical protein